MTWPLFSQFPAPWNRIRDVPVNGRLPTTRAAFYGPILVQLLAQNWPKNAMWNADSYSWFAMVGTSLADVFEKGSY